MSLRRCLKPLCFFFRFRMMKKKFVDSSRNESISIDGRNARNKDKRKKRGNTKANIAVFYSIIRVEFKKKP
jgi:hypothetical protein